MDIKACSVAADQQGQEFISTISVRSGFRVRAWDGAYNLIPYGKQWEASPDGGTVVNVGDSGRDPVTGKKSKSKGCLIRAGSNN